MLLLVGLLGTLSANGQYYYQDIYRTFETNQQHEQYHVDQIQNIQIHSFNAQKQSVPGFNCSKTFSPDYQKTTTVTQSFSTGADFLTSFFDDKGRLVYTIDSSATSIGHTRIYYSKSGEIDSLVFLSLAKDQKKSDTLLDFIKGYKVKEKHIYYYDSSGVPQKMLRLKNNRLYRTIYFDKDSSGRIFKEYAKDNDRPVYYYKYKAGQLTDVFHYNDRQKKMVPDYLFDYNEKGRLAKKTVVLANNHNYLDWHYSYNEKGQISKQIGYNDTHELQGILIFKYSYQP